MKVVRRSDGGPGRDDVIIEVGPGAVGEASSLTQVVGFGLNVAQILSENSSIQFGERKYSGRENTACLAPISRSRMYPIDTSGQM